MHRLIPCGSAAWPSSPTAFVLDALRATRAQTPHESLAPAAGSELQLGARSGAAVSGTVADDTTPLQTRITGLWQLSACTRFLAVRTCRCVAAHSLSNTHTHSQRDSGNCDNDTDILIDISDANPRFAMPDTSRAVLLHALNIASTPDSVRNHPHTQGASPPQMPSQPRTLVCPHDGGIVHIQIMDVQGAAPVQVLLTVSGTGCVRVWARAHTPPHTQASLAHQSKAGSSSTGSATLAAAPRAGSSEPSASAGAWRAVGHTHTHTCVMPALTALRGLTESGASSATADGAVPTNGDSGLRVLHAQFMADAACLCVYVRVQGHARDGTPHVYDACCSLPFSITCGVDHEGSADVDVCVGDANVLHVTPMSSPTAVCTRTWWLPTAAPVKGALVCIARNENNVDSVVILRLASVPASRGAPLESWHLAAQRILAAETPIGRSTSASTVDGLVSGDAWVPETHANVMLQCSVLFRGLSTTLRADDRTAPVACAAVDSSGRLIFMFRDGLVTVVTPEAMVLSPSDRVTSCIERIGVCEQLSIVMAATFADQPVLVDAAADDVVLTILVRTGDVTAFAVVDLATAVLMQICDMPSNASWTLVTPAAASAPSGIADVRTAPGRLLLAGSRHVLALATPPLATYTERLLAILQQRDGSHTATADTPFFRAILARAVAARVAMYARSPAAPCVALRHTLRFMLASSSARAHGVTDAVEDVQYHAAQDSPIMRAVRAVASAWSVVRARWIALDAVLHPAHDALLHSDVVVTPLVHALASLGVPHHVLREAVGLGQDTHRVMIGDASAATRPLAVTAGAWAAPAEDVAAATADMSSAGRTFYGRGATHAQRRDRRGQLAPSRGGARASGAAATDDDDDDALSALLRMPLVSTSVVPPNIARACTPLLLQYLTALVTLRRVALELPFGDPSQSPGAPVDVASIHQRAGRLLAALTGSNHDARQPASAASSELDSATEVLSMCAVAACGDTPERQAVGAVAMRAVANSISDDANRAWVMDALCRDTLQSKSILPSPPAPASAGVVRAVQQVVARAQPSMLATQSPPTSALVALVDQLCASPHVRLTLLQQLSHGCLVPAPLLSSSAFDVAVFVLGSTSSDAALRMLSHVDAATPPVLRGHVPESWKTHSALHSAAAGAVSDKAPSSLFNAYKHAVSGLPAARPLHKLLLEDDAAQLSSCAQTRVELLRRIDQGVDALRVLLHHDEWSAALALLSEAEEADDFHAGTDGVAIPGMDFQLASQPAVSQAMPRRPSSVRRSSSNSTASAPLAVVRREEPTLGTAAAHGVLSVAALLQGRLETVWKSATAPISRPQGRRGPRRVTDRANVDVVGHDATEVDTRVSSPALTMTALATAVRWGAASTLRLAYFHTLFMHTVSHGSTERLMTLWPRMPRGYTLPTVVLVLRSALTHPRDALGAPSRAASIPLRAVAPALSALVREHRRALDDMGRLWREAAHWKSDATVLRSWGATASSLPK